MKAGFKGVRRPRCKTCRMRMKRLRVLIRLDEGPRAGQTIKARDWRCRTCDV